MLRAVRAGVIAFGIAAVAFVVGLAFNDGADVPDFVVVVGILALACALSAAAIFIALRVQARIGHALARQQQTFRSIDAALAQQARAAARTSASIAELAEQTRRDIAELAPSQKAPAEAVGADAPSASDAEDEQDPVAPPQTSAATPNVIPLKRSGLAAGTDGDEATAIAAALEAETLEISLQPIVAVAQGGACGFEVFAHLPEHGDLRRPGVQTDFATRGRLELALLQASARTALRRFGDDVPAMALHVPVSAALLQDEAMLAQAQALYAQHPALSDSLLLSVPVHLINGATRRRAIALTALCEAGARLACEGWRGSPQAAHLLRDSAVDVIKLPVDRLLDRGELRAHDLTGPQIIAAARAVGIEPVATGVASEVEAVSLIDLGVDRMSGPHFADPSPLRRANTDGNAAM